MLVNHREKLLGILLVVMLPFGPGAVQGQEQQDDRRSREGSRERTERERTAPQEPVEVQDDDTEDNARTTDETATRGGARTDRAPTRGDTDREASRERILRTVRLPQSAEEVKKSGVPETEVQEVLRAVRKEGLPAADAQQVMEEGTRAAREGQADNFGSFVQSKLEEGLRGQDLADAIHAEKAARGKGGNKQPKGKANPSGQGKGGGKKGGKDKKD